MTTCNKEIDPADFVKPLKWKDYAIGGESEYRRGHVAEILNFQFRIYERFDGKFEYGCGVYKDLEIAKGEAQEWTKDFVRVACGHPPKYLTCFENSNY